MSSSQNDEETDEKFIAHHNEKMERRVLVTGGARGADKMWLDTACENSRGEIVVYSFKGHMRHIDNEESKVKDGGVTIEELEPKVLERNKRILEETTATRGHSLPYDERALPFLERDVSIACDCDFMFAVGLFEDSTSNNPECLKIGGGTGWTCQLFVNRMLKIAKQELLDYPEDDSPYRTFKRDKIDVNLYFFEQRHGSWMKPIFSVPISVQGVEFSATFKWKPVPQPTYDGISVTRYAGIGTRQLNKRGTDAIKDFYKKRE